MMSSAKSAGRGKPSRSVVPTPGCRRPNQPRTGATSGVTTSSPKPAGKVADAVGKAELDRLAAGPVFTGEQGFFWTLEPRAAAALHQADKVLVDVPLQRLEPLHVLRVLRQERVEHSLVLAGNIEPAID